MIHRHQKIPAGNAKRLMDGQFLQIAAHIARIESHSGSPSETKSALGYLKSC